MHTISNEVSGGRRRRREHSTEFKAQVVAACSAPGVSSAAVAMAHGLNPNLARRWVREAERDGGVALARVANSALPAAFVAVQLPPAETAPADIRIELSRGTTTIASGVRPTSHPSDQRQLRAEYLTASIVGWPALIDPEQSHGITIGLPDSCRWTELDSTTPEADKFLKREAVRCEGICTAMTRKTFILIPGAGGSAWYWHLVVPRLEQIGHEAVPVALPAADDAAGLPEYADAVVQAIGDREPRHVVIIAQSLGGFTAPLVCQQIPVALLVLVNAMIPKPGETPGAWWTDTRHSEARRKQNQRDGRRADAPFDPLVDFFHDVPQPVIDEAWAQGEPRQSDAVFASPCTFTSWPAVPTRVLVASEDRFFPVEFQRRVVRDRLGISPDEIPGGHLVALSQPDELTARLEAYVTEAARRPTDTEAWP